MQRSFKKDHSNDLENCFGFLDDDINLSILNNSSVINDSLAPVEFQSDKPFRLALYVKPRDPRRDYINSSRVANYANQKPLQKANLNKSGSKIKGKSGVNRVKTNTKRMTNIMLFDENVKPENEAKRCKTADEDSSIENNSILKSLSTSRKKVLTEINSKSMTKLKQCKIRKSYEKKHIEKDPGIIPERSSEDIIKELELKKLSRTKQKKVTKEEKEFEKWASDINSDFNDVDKFELSITYD